MIHTAGLIHRGIVNVSSIVDDSSFSVTNSQTDDFEFGNKMAVLSGDFLFANVSTGLAALNNTQVHVRVCVCVYFHRSDFVFYYKIFHNSSRVLSVLALETS